MAAFNLASKMAAKLSFQSFLSSLFARVEVRVGRSCACLEPNSYAKRDQNLPKEAKLQFF